MTVVQGPLTIVRHFSGGFTAQTSRVPQAHLKWLSPERVFPFAREWKPQSKDPYHPEHAGLRNSGVQM